MLKINDDYVSASAKRKNEIRNHNLRRIEDERIEKLAAFLAEYTMHHNIDTLMCDLKKNHVPALPSPSYLLHRDIPAPRETNEEDTDLLEQEETSDATDELRDQKALHSEEVLKIDPVQGAHESASSPTPNQEPSNDEYNDNSVLKKLRLFINTAFKATFFSHNKTDIHIHLSKISKSANSKYSRKGALYCCIATALLLICGGYYFVQQHTKPPVSELFPTTDEIILSPNQIYELKVAILPDEAVGAPLNYVSLNPTVATVSNKGFVLAHDIPQGAGCYTADILIQAESGVTATKPVTVKISDDVSFPPVVSDIDNYKPGFTIEQEVRLAGDKEWKNEVDAKVGDKVEFLITYTNTSDEDQMNVMIQDILPKNMCYVPNSTILYNGDFPSGGLMTDDGITAAGVNILNYEPNVTAYIKFTAEVIVILYRRAQTYSRIGCNAPSGKLHFRIM